MSKPTGPTNPNLKRLINELRTNKAYRNLAHELSRPARQRRAINLFELDMLIKEGEKVAVAGKILSEGNLTKKATIYTWQSSRAAQKKVEATGGKIEPLSNVLKEKDVRVVEL